MLLQELILHPITSRHYLERYVNDGSPSGFSTVYTTSVETSPFGLTPWYYLYVCIAPQDLFKDFGHIPSYSGKMYTDKSNWILLHPDMINKKFFTNKNFKIYKNIDLKVVPTASGRTVQIISDNNQDYIKLHYEGVLGRVRRELPYYKAVAGPEISKIIISAIDTNQLTNKLSILPETGARVLTNKLNNEENEWGMVWRENRPYKVNISEVEYIIPAFSLFSHDRLAIHHSPLIKQIIDSFKYNPEDFILDKIIFPLIECYFDLILKTGLQAEWNSQNLLIGFNDTFSSAKFIMRDLESVDKDITIMESIGVKHNFIGYPFKCIKEDQYNYIIKHSFMFDFKLGESILAPLIELAKKYYNLNTEKLQNRIKEETEKYIIKLPTNFFPQNKWYMFDRVLVDQSKIERPYLELKNPKFRF